MPTTSLKPEEPILQITTARIQILDILRGMALMGILIIHIATGMHWMFASPEQKALMPFPEINAILGPAIDFFFIDKSRTLFAFMFGLTFFIQLKSAEHHKKPFKRVFLWRLTILMILGLLHGHLIYGGDILSYYAVGGLLLLFVYNWSSRSLLILGFFLNIGIPIITTIVSILFEINLFGDFPDMESIHKAYMSTSFWDNLHINHLSAIWRYNAFFLLNFAIPATGIFLFGIWMGRKNYLQHPEKHLKSLKQFVGWGLGLGFLFQGGQLYLISALENKWIAGNDVLYVFMDFIYRIAVLLISLGYVSILTLLFLRPGWKRFLSILAPAGRMTLTNYIMQSVLLWIIFYGSGFGLYLKIGPSITIFIALALCGLQLLSSYYWLQYYKMGPLEWVWRYANTGKRPEFKKSVEIDNQLIS
jgi:uncharacterized protein